MTHYVTAPESWHHKLRDQYFVEHGEGSIITMPIDPRNYWIEVAIAVLWRIFTRHQA